MKQPLKLTTRQGERIAVVAGLRTPFAKQATAFHGVPAVDLGKLVVSELLARTDLDPALIDQLVFGQVVQMPEAPNIAREIVLGTGIKSFKPRRRRILKRCWKLRALLRSTKARARVLLTPMGSTEEESAPPAMAMSTVPAMMDSVTLATAWKLVAQARDTL